MKLDRLLAHWEGTQFENRWSRLFIAGLLCILLLMAFKILHKETIVVLQPVTLSVFVKVVGKISVMPLSSFQLLATAIFGLDLAAHR